MDREPGLVPELSVTDLAASRGFWCDLLGFTVKSSVSAKISMAIWHIPKGTGANCRQPPLRSGHG
jgi:hypothetical protein